MVPRWQSQVSIRHHQLPAYSPTIVSWQSVTYTERIQRNWLASKMTSVGKCLFEIDCAFQFNICCEIIGLNFHVAVIEEVSGSVARAAVGGATIGCEVAMDNVYRSSQCTIFAGD